jgi:hypothetical protein
MLWSGFVVWWKLNFVKEWIGGMTQSGHCSTVLICKIWGWLPLWSSGQSSWLQIQRSGFDSGHYQIFWEVVGLERGPLSLMSTVEELLGRKSSGSGLESQEYGRKDPSRWPCGTLYRQKLALTSSTSSGRLVGIVHLQTQATEFSFSCFPPFRI